MKNNQELDTIMAEIYASSQEEDPITSGIPTSFVLFDPEWIL